MQKSAVESARHVQESYYEVTLSSREGVNVDLIVEYAQRRYKHIVITERLSITYQIVEFFGTFHKLQKWIQELEKEEVWAAYEARHPKM